MAASCKCRDVAADRVRVPGRLAVPRARRYRIGARHTPAEEGTPSAPSPFGERVRPFPTGRSSYSRPSPTRPSSPSRTSDCSTSCRPAIATSPRRSSSRRRPAISCGSSRLPDRHPTGLRRDRSPARRDSATRAIRPGLPLRRTGAARSRRSTAAHRGMWRRPTHVPDDPDRGPARRGAPFWTAGVVHLTTSSTAGAYLHSVDHGSTAGHRTIVAAPLMRDGPAIGAITVRRAGGRAVPGRQIERSADFRRPGGDRDRERASLHGGRDPATDERTEALEQQTATAEILRVISARPTDLQPSVRRHRAERPVALLPGAAQRASDQAGRRRDPLRQLAAA